ncbi:MAG: DoxX family membrane protein [Ignavibacteriae bacterium]|nr:DoxX family membrane protein [Ignavibacteriota bacterium]
MNKAAFIIRYALALVFLVSGASKLFSPQDAASFFAEIFGVGSLISHGAVIALSLTECLLAGVLFSGRALPAVALISAFFFLIAFVLGGLNAGSDTSCGCFGELLESRVDEWFFVRNFLLFGLSMLMLKRVERNSNEEIQKHPATNS